MQVLAFNGRPVKNLKSLANMVESCDDEFLKFDLEYDQVLPLSLSRLGCMFASLISIQVFMPVGVSGSDIYGNLFVQIVVLRTKTAKATTVDILTTHCIPCAMSDDLKP